MSLHETVNIPCPGWQNVSTPDPAVRAVIERQYRRLPFPSWVDAPFFEALDTVYIPPEATLATYDKGCTDGVKNLLSYLYFSAETERLYAERGIPERILLDTLKDLVIWTDIWSNVKGTLHLGELSWLSKHLGGQLFRIGRLQYGRIEATSDIPSHGIRRGDGLLDMHIPADGRLTPEEVISSVGEARSFFKAYFPECPYVALVCHSWLLDETLKDYLPEGSNILRFGDMFDRVRIDDDNALLRYLFRWDTSEKNLASAIPTSAFAARVKEAVERGVQFHAPLGVLRTEALFER